MSVINQAIPYICERLIEEYGKDHVFPVPPVYTARIRTSLGFEKDRKNQMHEVDACCIALAAMNVCPDDVPEFDNTLTVKQFRRHDRAVINHQCERTYKEYRITTDKNGNPVMKWVAVAKNRKPRTGQSDNQSGQKKQTCPALSEWFETQVKLHGLKEAERMRSQLMADRSRRTYNNPDRMMPGAVFSCKGDICVMSGQLTGGQYFRTYGDKKTNYPVEKCTVIRHNEGLVFV